MHIYHATTIFCSIFIRHARKSFLLGLLLALALQINFLLLFLEIYSQKQARCTPMAELSLISDDLEPSIERLTRRS